MAYKSDSFDQRWLTEEITDATIDWAKNFGTHLASGGNNEKLSTTQLRRFFNKLKRLEVSEDVKTEELRMLDPLLAYAVGKSTTNQVPKPRIADLHRELKAMIKIVTKEEDRLKEQRKSEISLPAKSSAFNRFIQIMEAVVAFHKFTGGKNA